MNKDIIKNILIKLPPIYKIVYTFKLKYINKIGIEDGNDIRIQKIPYFYKKSFYDFVLNDIKFKIKLNPMNGGVDKEIFCFYHYEANILNIIKKNLNKNDVFIDIGANIGQHSLFASQLCKEVYAFEPITDIFNQMNESITENYIFNIRTFNIALGDKKEELSIFSNSVNVGASSVFKRIDNNFIQNIKVISLDNVIDILKIDKIDFMKIDVEGFEKNVLLGAYNTIKKHHPKIILEFTPYIYNVQNTQIALDIYNFLIDNKYKIFAIKDKTENMQEVLDFKDIKDYEQINLFCI